MRILHVVFKMGMGGLETWLVNVLRQIDRQRYQMDFLVQTGQKCCYDDEILSLGAKIIRIRAMTVGPKLFLFLRDFRNILREHGPYQVIHVHNTVRFGILLREASEAGIPVRIIHYHNVVLDSKRLITWPLRVVSRHWMHKYATAGLGCSRDACAAMFGKNWSKDPRYRILYYGIDLRAYRDQKDGVSVREELGIPRNGLVVGHIGRFDPQKNHDFIVDIAEKLVQQRDNVRFLLVGNGFEKARIEQRLHEMGLENYFVLAGERSDVPRMYSAMDIFIMPSLYEGLGIVLLEAQAMGLPCLMTHDLPSDVDVVDGLCHRLPLVEGPQVWAKNILTLAYNCPVKPSVAFETMEKSSFNIEVSARELTKVYEEGLSPNGWTSRREA